MSLVERFQAIQENLSRLIGIDDNNFNTSGFSRSEAMGNVRSLQNALGNLLGNSSGSGGSISGSVGKGGANKAEDVRRVQELLNQKAGAGLAVDGQFGPKTLAAIEAYQRSIFNGWSDGVIDPGGKTIQSLNGGSTASAPTAGSGNSTGGGLSGSVGQGGDNNAADVRRVQELLKGKGAQISVDGQIGPQTIGAIRSFQSANSIPTDGLIEPGRNTWKKLTGNGNDVGTGGSTGNNSGSPAPILPTGNYSYHEHANWRNVSLTYQAGSRTARQLNATAERLLRNVGAEAGTMNLTITSTKRDYTDQAYITLTQVDVQEALDWYSYVRGNQSLFYRYRQELADGRDKETVFREYGEYIKRVAGEGASNHIPGYAIDIVTGDLGAFNAAAESLVPKKGTGVRRLLRERGRSHIEFTFVVV